MSKGYLVIAQNNENDDYIRMAYALAMSIKLTQTVNNFAIMINPGTKIPEHYKKVFDKIIEMPDWDCAEHSYWKIQNKWKYFNCTPWEKTVILDADMLFFDDVVQWWELFDMLDKPIIATTQVKTYRQETVTSNYYRQTFVRNNLPNVYTAFMYFNKTHKTTIEYMCMAEVIFNNWKEFYKEFLHVSSRPTYLSADVAYAIAMKVIDCVDECTYPKDIPTFTHMKSYIQNWDASMITENWIKHVNISFSKDLKLNIANYRQSLPFHYHLSEFLTDKIIGYYEEKIND